MDLQLKRERRTGRVPQRSVLFLQGIASPFFAYLGRALADQGCRIHKVNFCLGDFLFWPKNASFYRGDRDGWREYLNGLFHRHGVTDICLFGDTRPLHAQAATLARAYGIAVHVFEEGYLRPHWITHEIGGANGHSTGIPRTASELKARASLLPEPKHPQTMHNSMLHRAGWEIAFHTLNLVGRPIHRSYRHHRPHHPLTEARGWVQRLSRRVRRRQSNKAALHGLAETRDPFFLVPLQLDADSQIKVHSPYRNIGAFLEHVCSSFAAHAPADAHLVIKTHPLDNGLVDHVKLCGLLAEKYELVGRITCIDGGNLNKLLGRSRGVVLINSTTGIPALERGTPVICLGTALYDLDGLTHQAGLDRFWQEPEHPAPEMVAAYERVVIHDTQVNGSFFAPHAFIDVAARSASRLLAYEPACMRNLGFVTDGASWAQTPENDNPIPGIVTDDLFPAGFQDQEKPAGQRMLPGE